MHIRNILVGIDGSEPANRALELAEDLSGQYGAALLLVTVLKPAPAVATELIAPPVVPTPAEIQNAQRDLQRRAGELRARGRTVDTQVEVGDPASTLLAIADRRTADVVVAGRSGKGALARAILGSVTTRLLHTSDRPVLIVP